MGTRRGKHSEYFLNLESRHYVSEAMPIASTRMSHGDTMTDQAANLAATKAYYY